MGINPGPAPLVKYRAGLVHDLDESIPEEIEWLSEEHDHDRACFTIHGQIRLIDTLCTDSRMDSVWRALEKRFNAPGLDYSVRLHQSILMESHAWIGKPKLTKAQSRALHRKIEKHASALVPLLWETMDNSLQFIPEFLNSEHWDRLNQRVRPSRDDERLERIRDDVLIYGALAECIPSLPSILRELATRAEDRISHARTMTQPNSKGARLHHFIEWMAHEFMTLYNTPLHTHVATLANVVMGGNETRDSVRLFLAQKQRRAEPLFKLVPLNELPPDW